MGKVMTCSCYLHNDCAFSCPRALYIQFGPGFGFNISCEECGGLDGFCDNCLFRFSEMCPLFYVLAEAEPVW